MLCWFASSKILSAMVTKMFATWRVVHYFNTWLSLFQVVVWWSVSHREEAWPWIGLQWQVRKTGQIWSSLVWMGNIWYHYIYICTTVEKDQRDSEFVSFQTNQWNTLVFFFKALEKNKLKVAIFFWQLFCMSFHTRMDLMRDTFSQTTKYFI